MQYVRDRPAEIAESQRKKITLTNTNAGATNAVVEISSTGFLEIEVLTVGPDDTLTARTITAHIQNAAGGSAVVVERLTVAAGVALDDQKLDLLSPAGAADGGRLNSRNLNLHVGDVIRITAAALLLNETLKVWVRAYGQDILVTNASAAGVTGAASTG